MNQGNDIKDELRNMGSTLASMPREMPYSVPDGYFGQFADTVKVHCTTPWGRQLPYTIPAGYFDELPNQVLAAAAESNDDIGNVVQMPFASPQGYFEQLPLQMLAAAKAQDQDNTKRIRLAMSVRWAAAAILLLSMGIGGYQLYNNNAPAQDTPTEHILASVQAPELEEYLAGNYRMDVEIIEKNDDLNKMKLDEQDIIKYLDETGWDM